MSDTRLCPQRLGYVHLKVKNLDKSLAFWTRAVPLEISARQGGKVYLRGGMQHHWIVLEESAEPGLGRVALEVETRAELDAFEAHLKALGVAAQVGDGLESDRVERYLRFCDPAGNPIELYCDMVSMPTPPQPRTVQLLDIQHVVLAASDMRAAAAFYRDVVGMRESDWVEHDVCFLHMKNGWHHGIGVGGFGAAGGGLNHICFQPPGLDDVMRARAIGAQARLPDHHGPAAPRAVDLGRLLLCRAGHGGRDELRRAPVHRGGAAQAAGAGAGAGHAGCVAAGPGRSRTVVGR